MLKDLSIKLAKLFNAFDNSIGYLCNKNKKIYDNKRKIISGVI